MDESDSRKRAAGAKPDDAGPAATRDQREIQQQRLELLEQLRELDEREAALKAREPEPVMQVGTAYSSIVDTRRATLAGSDFEQLAWCFDEASGPDVRDPTARGSGYQAPAVPKAKPADAPDHPRCPKCTSFMILKTNSHNGSLFWSCPAWPRCDGKQNLCTALQQAFRNRPATMGAAAASAAPEPAAPPTQKQLLEAFRRAVYDRQCKDGVLTPSSHARWETVRIKQQATCPHPFASLAWGGNKQATYATCRACSLAQVIYAERKEVHVAATTELPQIPEMEASHAVHLVDMPPGYAMLDTGCRAPVAGEVWHEALQDELRKLNLEFTFDTDPEHFRFGDGATVTSRKAGPTHSQWEARAR